MKTKLNVFKPHFHLITSHETGNKRNFVSFCLIFSDYENETKRGQNPCSWLWQVWKRQQTKLEVILWLLKDCDNDLNESLNSFSCLWKIEKDKLCLKIFHLGMSYIKLVRIFVNIVMKQDKFNLFSEIRTLKWMKMRFRKSFLPSPSTILPFSFGELVWRKRVFFELPLWISLISGHHFQSHQFQVLLLSLRHFIFAIISIIGGYKW